VQMWRSQVGKRRGRRVKRDASLLKLGASSLASCCLLFADCSKHQVSDGAPA
jgi:hypothetical protein